MRKTLLPVAALLLAACSSGSSADPSAPTTTEAPATTTTTEAGTTTAAPPSTTTAVTTTTATARSIEPSFAPRVTVVGDEEVVFDWTVDQCEPEHIPDIAPRAFRDAEGMVHLSIGHYVNYRMIGPELDEVVTDCSGPTLVSDFDPDPAQFNDSEWIGAPYTFDGETVYAVVHNEYRGDTHRATRTGQCPSGRRLTCLDTSLTMQVSTDGGDTFQDIVPAPGHMIATLPHIFDDEGVPSGLRQPSNIIQGPDGFLYVFSNISAYPTEQQWMCAMRTDDLADPRSWRYWDGAEFAGIFADPYADPDAAGAATCAPLATDQLSASVNETIVFDEVLQLYVMMGITFHPTSEEPHWGVYYSFSENLIDWTLRELLLEVPVNPSVPDPANQLMHAYPAVIDPGSTSLNFETTDGGAYLYLSRFNAGGNSLDRDLVRWPIELAMVEIRPPEWDFDTDGDPEGWYALNGLSPLDTAAGSLIMESTGDDPYLASAPMTVPAAYDRIAIRMKLSGDTTVQGQLFFGTDATPFYDESASLVFDVIADGEFHEYVLDMSAIPAWQGTIVSLRLDPAPDAGRSIAIDRIWFPDA